MRQKVTKAVARGLPRAEVFATCCPPMGSPVGRCAVDGMIREQIDTIGTTTPRRRTQRAVVCAGQRGGRARIWARARGTGRRFPPAVCAVHPKKRQ